MKRLLPILLSLLLSGAALAAPVEEARTAWQTAGSRVQATEQARSQVAAAHEAMAQRIVQAKASRQAVLPGVETGQLDRLLKESEVLAGQLETLDRQVAQAHAQADAARRALVQALDARVNADRQAMAQAPAAERRARFEGLKTLLDERAALVQAGAVAQARSAGPAAVRLPGLEGSESASPDELRELADEVRDHEEKVRGHLTALEGRLENLRARRRLLRAARDFATDTALFGEDERNRRVARVDNRSVRAAVGTEGGNKAGAGDRGNPTGGIAAEPDSDGENQRFSGGVNDGQDAPPMAGAGGDAEPGAGPEEAPSPPPGDGGQNLGETDDAAVDPSVGFAPEAEAPTIGLPGGGDVVGADGVTVDQVLDPQLLVGDVDDLSPEELTEHIRRVEARRAALKDTARALESRQNALEARARAIEEE